MSSGGDDLRSLLLRQKQVTQSRVDDFAKEAEAHRQSLTDALRRLDDAAAELKRIDLVLATLEKAASKKPTIMDAVLEVLKDQPNGMTALEILAEINMRYFNGAILRTSLSPQLSRLKDRDHKIVLRGTKWFIAPEQPPAQPSLPLRRV